MRSLVVLSITGVVFAAWFVATASVDWSIVGMVVVCAGMTRAFTA